ncbi:MAG: NahK/ErcS family hybrid sensor histidine kinase/response regulator [Alphaproteobacteria bacterium]
MVPGWAVLALSFGYVGLLFALAYYGDWAARTRGRPAGKPVVYALSLAVYCTSWTFYGSVGLASRTGYDFLPIYLGPILMFSLGLPLMRRIVRVSKSHNITSIADLIAARYGKSQMLAAVVTVIAVVGVLPYIALQLKAVSTSFTVLMQQPMSAAAAGAAGPALWNDTALIVSLVLALFAILFGTRNINATEHNEGMMLAIAFESLVKLVAFISVGVFVTWGMFDGWADLLARARAAPELGHLFSGGVDGATWVTMTGLALTAIVCLPRQFHVAVVENVNERDLRKAAWLFPLYLVAINIFVIPIAVAGLLVFGDTVHHGDMFVLALPMAGRQEMVTLLAFIGGLSASTAMVIVESVAISNMVSNDLVMPIVLHRRRLGLSDREDMGKVILQVRRVAIVAFMLLAYFAYRLLGDSYALASIGLLSFAAVAQFAPALLGGLIWRGATQKGAMAGILAGFSVWAYCLLVPTLVQAGAFSAGLLDSGPFGIGLLRPQQLFGLRFDPLTHGVFWSLLANVAAYALVSLLSVPKVIERLQATAFVDADGNAGQLGLRHWHGSARVSEMATVAASYLGPDRAQRAFEDFAAQRGTPLVPDAEADFGLVRHTERMLASAIGAASARLVMALTLERRNLSADDAMRLLDDATAAIQYNRDLLQSTLENVRQGISVFDRELRLVCWNRRFRDLLELPAALGSVGVTLPEIMRFNAERGEYGPGNPDDLVAHQLELFLGDGEAVLEYRRPNGTVLEVRRSPMPGGGCVTTYSDITEHVRVAAQLAAANEHLEQRVRERTAELTALNAELNGAKTAAEEANLGKTRFLAAASHDLLQPLNAARLYVSSLVERHAARTGGLSGPDGELVRKVDASLGSVEELLGTLLDISKLDAGGWTPERHNFALGELCEALRLEFAPLAERKGLDLRIVPSRLAVESDRQLLHRVLQNLLSNAIRYTTAGKVLLGVRRTRTALLIQVWDTGCGIPRDKQPLVFKEFQRFASGPGTEHGLGLGLSIVERISRILDHPVSFRSVPGRGTAFTLRVPRGTAAVAPLRLAFEPVLPLQPAERVTLLCIDNEPSVLDGLTSLLEGWSYRMRPARGLAAALELDRAGLMPPDLLIVDYHLGGGDDGIDCIVALRHHYRAEVPAILITADRSEPVKSRARSLALPILNKPLKPAALRALIMRAIAARQAAE